jgi:hypothetical protein
MTNPQRSGGLQIIFSFFLGLMVTTFIGVGVYTFHPPNEEFDRRIEELNREENLERGPAPARPTSPEEEADMRELQAEREALYESSREAREAWGRSTSIVLILFATLVMAISLIRSDQLPVISNGLLLGGVFTMVYGVGWIVASDTSVARFIVVTVAFAITLALGYMRFVRRGRGSVPTGEEVRRSRDGGGVKGDQDLSDLQGRVHALEQRLEAAGRAFEGK